MYFNFYTKTPEIIFNKQYCAFNIHMVITFFLISLLTSKTESGGRGALCMSHCDATMFQNTEYCFGDFCNN